jgi:uncharacterized protein YjbI with pentapeptide repeats
MVNHNYNTIMQTNILVKKLRIIHIMFLFCSTFSVLGQIVNIPDPYFKSFLINEGIDTNNDGEIQVSEAEIVTYMGIFTQYPVTSLEGIQSFTSLERLSYDKNWMATEVITEIDLSNNINLEYLSLRRNDLESIDLSNNLNLETLRLSGNFLTEIDLSNNLDLTILELYNMTERGGPGISNLDLSANINLQEVGVAASNLSFLNIQNGNNLMLEHLEAASNPLLSCILVDDENYVYPDCVFTGSSMEGWCIDSWTTLSEDCLLSIDDSFLQQIKIYPNPAFDILNIESQEPIEWIQIFDISGSIIFSQYYGSNKVDISRLQSGLYFVKLKTLDNFYNQKLMVE